MAQNNRARGRHAAPHRESSGGRTAAIAVGVIAAVVAVVYLAGVAAFSFIFLPRTTLDGQDVSLKFASSVSSAYSSKVATYQVNVSGDGLDYTVKGADIGLSFDEAAYEKGTLGQINAWAWPLEIVRTHDISAQSGATFDEDKLRSVFEEVVNAYNEKATQPTDATIAFDSASNQYQVVPEKAGTAVDLDALVSQVSDDIKSLPSRITVDDSALVQPKVASTDETLQTAAKNANKFLTADIPLTLGGAAAGKVTRAQIADWITLDENNNATLDQTKLAAWVKDNVAAKYDTVAQARTYTRPDGKQVSVPASDSHYGNYYGWTTDEAALVTQLTSAIEAGSTTAVDIPTKQTASAVPDAGKRDWGNCYIDVDLSEQHARFYDDSGNIIWETDFVSGDHSKNYDTPSGVFVLNSNRDSDHVKLTGGIDSKTGQPSYISYVDYWMPFIDNAWAFHDASWRSKFGGTVYETNGSHGCINLPPEKAKELYGLCKVGDVVVVHN